MAQRQRPSAYPHRDGRKRKRIAAVAAACGAGLVGYGVYATTLSLGSQAGSAEQAGGDSAEVQVSCQDTPVTLADVYSADLDAATGYTPKLLGFDVSGVSEACAGRVIRLSAEVQGQFREFDEVIPVVSGQSAYRILSDGVGANQTTFATGYSVQIVDGPYRTSQVTGTLQVDRPLSFLVEAEAGVVSTYRWERSLDGGQTWTTIAGATAATYTTVQADEGAQLRAWATTTYAGQDWSVKSQVVSIQAAGNGTFASPTVLGIPAGASTFDMIWDNLTSPVAPSTWGDTRLSWYSWTPTTSGTLTLRTQMLEDWDPTLQVYNSAGVKLTENDDSDDPDAPCTPDTYCPYNAEVTFNYQAGETYRFGFGGYALWENEEDVVAQGTARVYFTFS